MPTCRVMNKQGENRDYLRRMQITGLSTRVQMDRHNIRSLSHTKSTDTYTVCVAAKSTTFWLPLRACQNLTNSTDAKTKMLMEKIVNLHLPRLHLRLPPYLPSHLCFLLGWLATVRILNERPFLSSQSASHLGKGDLDGESSLASGFDPRVLWQSLGLRNLESIFHRPVSPSTRAFMASPLPLRSIYLISKHILYTHTYVFASTDTSLGFFSLGSQWKKTKRKQSFSESSSHAVLLCDFIRYRLLMKGTVSSVCEYTSRNIPRGLFCVLYVCVCVCMHTYQVGFTWAGSTSLSITMDVQW